MFCENCGTKLPEGSKFCSGCGTSTVPPSSPSTATVRTVSPPPVYASPVQTLPPQQQTYSPSPYPTAQPMQTQSASEPLNVGQYMGMLILMCIPILNIILLFAWGFGSSVNLNKKNFARASLILWVIVIAVWIVAMVTIGSSLIGIMGRKYY